MLRATRIHRGRSGRARSPTGKDDGAMTERPPDTPRTIVIGGGMAGLTCAALLHEAGQAVLLLEAGDGVGGRVRTDRHPDGFLLDRGYQVILEAYPALRR